MSTDMSDYTDIKEGEAEILMHAKNEVFYNKTQVNNRDISIAVLRTFISKQKEEYKSFLSRRKKVPPKIPEKPIYETEVPTISNPKATIDSALSASGLRAIRYAREVECIGEVVALDNDKVSVEASRRNIKFNGSVASSKVDSQLADAHVYMLTNPKEFDMVDLDPYGSPSVILDSAVQSIADGGMLMCTATDMAVLCGGNGEVCYSKTKKWLKYCHEMALCILLACIESHANRYKRYIVPILSVQMHFYVRIFVRVYTSASAMKNTPLKLSYVYQRVDCDSFHLQPIGRTVSKVYSVHYLTFCISVKYQPGFGPVVPQECSDCGKKYNMGWSIPIHDQEWVSSILELPDVPLFLSLHNLCATLKCTFPSAVIFRSAVINAGYRISGTHVNPLGLESGAPMNVIWDTMRCWVKSHPVKAQSPDYDGSIILAKEAELQANFAIAVASLSKAQAKKITRFLPNPERHWSPKLKAGRTITSKHVSLLGPHAINGTNNNEESDEPQAKRKKPEDSTSAL
ncbi:hypothetical protein DCAR_0312511 [Daucus carota subsp. sativus]|uniref:tRNA (guanine(26)-N(2))-dimethyltransferase n=1 Tax=Daucus carota subsp. sativus TaxID=79200 RepID=A0AAF0WNQ4_DAUCS|nr:hypothetical protein DCAR_0312511 [Daucus carota subsp. sativus]